MSMKEIIEEADRMKNDLTGLNNLWYRLRTEQAANQTFSQVDFMWMAEYIGEYVEFIEDKIEREQVKKKFER